MSKTKGIAYMRTMRDDTPVLYNDTDDFTVGGSRVFGDGPVTVIATGVTVHEALKAQKEVPGIRVIDCYSIKPIDAATLKKAVATSKAIIVVEDHYPEGGLGEAVSSLIGPITHLAVRKIPRSGKPEELLAYEQVDAKAIADAAKRVTSR
jgi:transketolase